MKKAAIIVGIVAVVLIIIIAVAACGEPSTPTRTPTPTPSQSPAPPIATLTPAESNYLNIIETNSQTCGTALTELGQLLSDAQIFDEDWIVEVAIQMATIRLCYEEMLATTPPDSMLTIHNKYIQALQHFNNACSLLAEGIDNLDMDSMDQAITEMELGNQFIDEATTAVKDFKEEHNI